MNKIYKDLSDAVTYGQLEKLKDLINRFGVYNSGYCGYYCLLCKSIKLKHTEITKLLLTSGSKEDSNRKETIASNTPLHFAVLDEDLEIIEMLIDHGASIHALGEFGSSPLLSAICMGKGKIVDLLIKKGTNPKTYNEGKSNLHIAAEQAFNNIKEKLSSAGSLTGERSTPVQFASTIDKEKLVKLPLDNNADINARTNNMITILYFAVRNSHSKRHLFFGDYKVNKSENGETELNCAVCKGLSMIFEDILENKNKASSGSETKITITTVEKLLKYDFLIETFDDISQKVSWLQYIKSKLIKMVQSLFRSEDFACDNEDLSCVQRINLHFTTKHKNFEVFKLLFTFELEPVINQTTGKTKTPAVYYSTENSDASLNKFLILLHKHAKPKRCFSEYYVTFTKNVIDVFYQYDSKIECAINCSTPLEIACYQGNVETIEMLLENGVNVNSKQENGNTALHIVAKRYNIDVLKILLERGADVFAKNEEGYTPLHVASNGTDVETVSILLQYGSPVDSITEYGETPLDVVIDYCLRPEFVNLLLKFGSDISSSKIQILCGRVQGAPERDIYTSCFGPPRHSYGQLPPRNQCCFSGFDLFILRPEENPHWEEQKIVLNILLYHLIMLKTANLVVNEELQQFIIRHSGHNSKLYKEKCENEIKALKLEKISNSNLSFYDILTKSMQSLARYVRNEDIIKNFDSDNYQTKFPIYASLLERNLKLGVFYEMAQEFFYRNFNLPYECCDQIFQYFNTADVERFMFGISLHQSKINVSLIIKRRLENWNMKLTKRAKTCSF